MDGYSGFYLRQTDKIIGENLWDRTLVSFEAEYLKHTSSNHRESLPILLLRNLRKLENYLFPSQRLGKECLQIFLFFGSQTEWFQDCIALSSTPV